MACCSLQITAGAIFLWPEICVKYQFRGLFAAVMMCIIYIFISIIQSLNSTLKTALHQTKKTERSTLCWFFLCCSLMAVTSSHDLLSTFWHLNSDCSLCWSVSHTKLCWALWVFVWFGVVSLCLYFRFLFWEHVLNHRTAPVSPCLGHKHPWSWCCCLQKLRNNIQRSHWCFTTNVHLHWVVFVLSCGNAPFTP